MTDDSPDVSTLWVTTGGEVVHPDAPAGSGGGGRFRAAGSLGVSEPFDPTLPAATAPAARYVVTPDPLDASGVKANPPPATPTGVTQIGKSSDANNEIDVSVEVLADGTNTSEPGQAHTKLETGSVVATYPNIFVDDKTKKITKLTSKFTLMGTATIQIRYRPGVDKAEPSAYGRGKTVGDQATGDISVGFHECSHVKDMLAWLKANALPKFPNTVGMTEKEFDSATAAYDTALDNHFKAASDNSHKLTDETGNPTRSQWLAANP